MFWKQAAPAAESAGVAANFAATLVANVAMPSCLTHSVAYSVAVAIHHLHLLMAQEEAAVGDFRPHQCLHLLSRWLKK